MKEKVRFRDIMSGTSLRRASFLRRSACYAPLIKLKAHCTNSNPRNQQSFMQTRWDTWDL